MGEGLFSKSPSPKTASSHPPREKKGQGSPVSCGSDCTVCVVCLEFRMVICVESFCGGGMGEGLFSKSSSPYKSLHHQKHIS